MRNTNPNCSFPSKHWTFPWSTSKFVTLWLHFIISQRKKNRTFKLGIDKQPTIKACDRPGSPWSSTQLHYMDWHKESHPYNWQPFSYGISLQQAFWRNEKDILSMPQMKAATNEIKFDFRVSKAYRASAEDRLSKFQACRAITWYKEDTDNWHFHSSWQLYLTRETLL